MEPTAKGGKTGDKTAALQGSKLEKNMGGAPIGGKNTARERIRGEAAPRQRGWDGQKGGRQELRQGRPEKITRRENGGQLQRYGSMCGEWSEGCGKKTRNWKLAIPATGLGECKRPEGEEETL